MIDSYFTIDKYSSAEIRISRSKFIAQVFPVKTQSDINSYIFEAKKKFYDASHHPYAFRIAVNNDNFRVSDDGEPAGTAGKPILEAIDKFNITDILLIVSRYFGGIKLGTGGLRRAFSDAADTCLNNAVIIEKLITERINLEFDYKYMNQIMNLIEAEKIKLKENNSDEKCKLIVEVRLSKIEELKDELINTTNGNINLF